MVKLLIATALTALLVTLSSACAEPLAKELFGAEHSASRQKAAPYGRLRQRLSGGRRTACPKPDQHGRPCACRATAIGVIRTRSTFIERLSEVAARKRRLERPLHRRHLATARRPDAVRPCAATSLASTSISGCFPPRTLNLGRTERENLSRRSRCAAPRAPM